MKKIYMFAAFLTAFLAVGCSNNDLLTDSEMGESLSSDCISIKDIVVKADISSGTGSRTSVTSGGVNEWLEGDALTLWVRPANVQTEPDWLAEGLVHTFILDKTQTEGDFFRHDPNCEFCKGKPQFVLQAGEAYDWYVCHQCEAPYTKPSEVHVAYPQSPLLLPESSQLADKQVVSPLVGKLENYKFHKDFYVAPNFDLSLVYPLMSFDIVNKNDYDMTLKSVKFEALSGEVLWGKVAWNLQTGIMSPAYTPEEAAQQSSYVVNMPAEGVIVPVGETYNIHFTMLPFTLQKGEKFVMTATYADAQGVEKTSVLTKKMENPTEFTVGKLHHTTFEVGENLIDANANIVFEDPVFKKFLVEGTELGKRPYDTDGDKEISYAEAEAITDIFIDGQKLFPLDASGQLSQAEPLSLKELVYMPNLYHLAIRGAKSTLALKELNLRENLRLNILNIRSTDMKKIDLSQNSKLRQALLSYNNLASLDVSHNPLLTDLFINNNHIHSISLQNCPNIESLYCSNNPIGTLDVTNLHSLQILSCSNTNIQTLDVSQNPNLVEIRFSRTKISSMNFENNSLLKIIDCQITPIVTFSVKNLNNLEKLYCDGGKFSNLDVTANKKLTTLFCAGSLISSIDVSQNPLLAELSLNGCPISSINLSSNPELTYLTLNGCKSLQTLDLRVNTKLVSLEVNGCPIQSLDTSLMPNLMYLYCESCNKLNPTFDISANTSLNGIRFRDSSVREILVWEGFNVKNPPLDFEKNPDTQFVIKQAAK